MLTLADPELDAMTPVKLGKLVVISGPSGVGKSTVVPGAGHFGPRLRERVGHHRPREGEQRNRLLFPQRRRIRPPPGQWRVSRIHRGFRPRPLVRHALERGEV
jgi:hypothetical protein